MTHRGWIEWAKLYTAVPQPPVIGGCGPQEITVRKSSRCLWPLKADEPLAFGGHGALDELEVVEGDAGAHGDAFKGVVGDVAGNADLLGDEAVEVSELRGAAAVYTTSAISPLDFPPLSATLKVMSPHFNNRPASRAACPPLAGRISAGSARSQKHLFCKTNSPPARLIVPAAPRS